jgi:hypothetical protein
VEQRIWLERRLDVKSKSNPGDPEWPRGWAEHRRLQARIGLRMTPAERLRWLEETVAALRRWQGLARRSKLPKPDQ